MCSDFSNWVPCNSSGSISRQRSPRASGPRPSRPRAAARHDKSSILPSDFQPSISMHRRTWSIELGDLRVGRVTTSSATCPVNCVDGAHSESAATSRSQPFRSRTEPLQRTGFLWRTATQMLELRLDALQRPVWPRCTQFGWFSTLLGSLTQLCNVLHCSVNDMTHDAKVPTRKGPEEKSKTAWTIIIIIIIIIVTFSWHTRDAPRRRVHLKTTQQCPGWQRTRTKITKNSLETSNNAASAALTQQPATATAVISDSDTATQQ